MAEASLTGSGYCPKCRQPVENIRQHLDYDHETSSDTQPEEESEEETHEPKTPWEFFCDSCNKWLKGHRMRHFNRMHPHKWPRRKVPPPRLERQRKVGQKKKQRYHIRCPVPGCRDVVKKLRQHLKISKKHKSLSNEDVEYFCSVPKAYKGKLPSRKRRHVPLEEEREEEGADSDGSGSGKPVTEQFARSKRRQRRKMLYKKAKAEKK
jgi:hypothetical protein